MQVNVVREPFEPGLVADQVEEPRLGADLLVLKQVVVPRVPEVGQLEVSDLRLHSLEIGQSVGARCQPMRWGSDSHRVAECRRREFHI